MLKSMTGFGRSEQTIDGRKIAVELRSVNHRYLDFNIRCPRVYSFLEEPVKNTIQSSVARGKLDVFISVDAPPEENVKISLNRNVLESYLKAFYAIRDEYSIADDITVTKVAGFPEIFDITKEETDAQTLKNDVLTVLEAALSEFNKMRETEGEKLVNDVLGRAGFISELNSFIEERSPKTVEEYRAKMEQRMTELLSGAGIDPQRILAEAALFADKTSVAEETVRLK
ncbi:MAG: YicC/YloC family endoribonuclease, partial [Bacillota bacterium]|nr:YicC/YloC family endoribonuclease [Bacillota bacterium]